MNKVLNFLAALGGVLFAVLLLGCGEEYKVGEGYVPYLEQSIFVLPETYSGEPYLAGSPAERLYMDAGTMKKFSAAYSLDGTYLTRKDADGRIQGTFWEVEGEIINLVSFRGTFETPGFRRIYLYSIDVLGDTIKDSLDVFVNTPIALELKSPEKDDNLVDPLAEDGVLFTWDVSGIDSWENSRCFLYASTNIDSLWDSQIRMNDCSHGERMKGPLAKGIPRDSSVTFYWGVKAVNFTEDNFSEVAVSPVQKFSTRFVNGDSAILKIPLIYQSLKAEDSVYSQILLTDAKGNEISTFENRKAKALVEIRVKPQSGLRLTVKEKERIEFKPVSIQMDVPVATLVLVDTLNLVDSIPPQGAPVKEGFSVSDSIRFYVLDRGSGIDVNRTSIIYEGDTLRADYAGNIMSFKNPCVSSCTIRLNVYDRAKNQIPETYWKIERRLDSTYVRGPFPGEAP